MQYKTLIRLYAFVYFVATSNQLNAWSWIIKNCLKSLM